MHLLWLSSLKVCSFWSSYLLIGIQKICLYQRTAQLCGGELCWVLSERVSPLLIYTTQLVIRKSAITIS